MNERTYTLEHRSRARNHHILSWPFMTGWLSGGLNDWTKGESFQLL